jgi:hypothetical protein
LEVNNTATLLDAIGRRKYDGFTTVCLIVHANNEGIEYPALPRKMVNNDGQRVDGKNPQIGAIACCQVKKAIARIGHDKIDRNVIRADIGMAVADINRKLGDIAILLSDKRNCQHQKEENR